MKENKIPVNVMFFSNGNTAAFGIDDKQIPMFQQSWFLLYIDLLRSSGLSIEELENIKFTFPGGKIARYIDKYNNWRFEC